MSPLETEVLTHLLAGDHPVLAALRAQRVHATVRDREVHASGLLLDLWVEDAAVPLAVEHRFAIDDLFGRIHGVPGEAGFLLHVVRGRLKTLEAFLDRDRWPEAPTLAEAWYVIPDPEDAGQLHRVPSRDLGFALRGLSSPD